MPRKKNTIDTIAILYMFHDLFSFLYRINIKIDWNLTKKKKNNDDALLLEGLAAALPKSGKKGGK